MSVPSSRPRSIIRFERAFAAVIVLQAGYVVLGWWKSGGWLDQMPFMTGGRLAYVVLASVGGLTIHALVLFYAGRRAGEIARVFVGILLVLRFFSYGRHLWLGHDPLSAESGLMLLALISHALATWLVWRPDANSWFAGRPAVDPEIFR